MLHAPKSPIVCYVTDRKSQGDGPDSAAVRKKIQMAIEAGADWVQIREKDLPGRELADLVRGAVAARREHASSRVIVNDRLDVALAEGAAGVHLGRESLSASDVVRWCRSGVAPAEFLVGVSCHSIDEAHEAGDAGASYIFLVLFLIRLRSAGWERRRESCVWLKFVGPCAFR